MDAIWRVLDLAPTDDAIAIKRAYAKRLKTTRPDDDAAAYQRLREAYDHALEWARYRRLHGAHDDAVQGKDDACETIAERHGERASEAIAEGIDVAPVSAERDGENADAKVDTTDASASADDGFVTGPHEVSVEPSSERDATLLPPLDPADDGFGTAIPEEHIAATEEPDTTFLPPSDIAHGVYDFWKKYGNEALVQLWPRVRDDLDRLPFALQPEASNWMASLVLEQRSLPPAFVEALAGYFHWGLDFRIAQVLGTERSHALSAHLRDLGVLRNNDPVARRRFADVLQIDALRTAGRRTAAFLLSLLLPERTLERWHGLPERLRNGLRIDAWAADDIGKWLMGAAVFRAALFVVLIAALLTLLPTPGHLAAIYGVLVAVLTLMAWSVAQPLRFAIDRWQQRLFARVARLGERPRNLRLGIGVALVLSAAVIALVDVPGWHALLHCLAWLTIAGGLLLVWHPAFAWRGMLLPVAIVLHVCLRCLLPDATPTPTVFSLALAWTVGAHWVMVNKFDTLLAVYRNPFAVLRPTHAWGWVLWIVFFKGVAAFATAFTILLLPATLMMQSIGYGQRFAFASIALGLVAGLVFSGGTGLADGWPLLGLLLAPIVLGALQGCANALARSRPFRS